MTAREVAEDHYRDRQALVAAVAAEGAALWRDVNPARLDSWARSAARLLIVLAGAQRSAARQADAYVDAALAEEGASSPSAGRVDAGRFAGVASDGRPLDSLLWQPVVASKLSIAQGATMPRALASGHATLDMILRTQVADAGRVADGVAVTARAGTGYVRMVRGRSCARCIILAGRFYRWSSGFRRHPRCDCVHVPAKGEQAAKSEGLVSNPKEAFDSLSKAEQDRIYTKAGARAIRDGADMSQVVNARRGMTVAGTTEGTTRRGFAGSRLQGQRRLMPEQIYRDARSREEVVRLLRLHGYLI